MGNDGRKPLPRRGRPLLVATGLLMASSACNSTASVANLRAFDCRSSPAVCAPDVCDATGSFCVPPDAGVGDGGNADAGSGDGGLRDGG